MDINTVENLKCTRCNFELPENELWTDNIRGCTKHNIVKSRRIKYTCPNCYYDQWWTSDPRFKDAGNSRCAKCVKEEAYNRKLINKAKLDHSLLIDFTVSNSCMESYPCQHGITYRIRDIDLPEDDQIVIVHGSGDGVSINKFYREMDLNVPAHFRGYGDDFFDRINKREEKIKSGDYTTEDEQKDFEDEFEYFE